MALINYGCFTQGLSSEYDLKKIIKVAKKEFACNGTVVDHSEYGEVLQLQVKEKKLTFLSPSSYDMFRVTNVRTFASSWLPVV